MNELMNITLHTVKLYYVNFTLHFNRITLQDAFSMNLWLSCDYSDDDKYAVEEDGLRINQLDLKDNGTYECRAEVESHGNVKIRSVSLEVICKHRNILPSIHGLWTQCL